MNREIKFRAWYKNKYHYNIEKHHVEHHSMAGFMGEVWDFSDWLANAIVQQYTGLKDKNGIEIYEGDIVKAKTWYPEEDGYVHPTSIFEQTGTVKFEYGGFYICEDQTHESLCFYYSSDEHQVFPDSEIEVIGNIFEP